MGNPGLQLNSSGGDTKGEIVTDNRRGIQDSVPGEKPVGLVGESLLSASHSQPFLNLARQVLKEPRFHVLVPWQPALFQAGNHPGPSVGAEVNLGGVAAEFNSNIGGRVSKTCVKNSSYNRFTDKSPIPLTQGNAFDFFQILDKLN